MTARMTRMGRRPHNSVMQNVGKRKRPMPFDMGRFVGGRYGVGFYLALLMAVTNIASIRERIAVSSVFVFPAMT